MLLILAFLVASGTVYCSAPDSPQTRAAEARDLATALPPGYRTFSIVAGQDSWLRIVVPAQSLNTAMKTIPHDAILDIWTRVLARHHPHCSVTGKVLQFVNPSGKEIFTVNLVT